MCWPLNQNMVIVLCTPTHLATIQTRERIMYAKLGFCHVNWCRRLSGTKAALVLSPDPFWCLGTRMRLIDFAFTNLTFHTERRVWSHCNWWIVPTLEYWCDQSDSCYSWMHQICHNTEDVISWLSSATAHCSVTRPFIFMWRVQTKRRAEHCCSSICDLHGWKIESVLNQLEYYLPVM